MAKLADQKYARFYAAVAHFVEAALRNGTSLFDETQPVWTSRVIEDLHRRFVLQPDESKRDFLSKFREQLKGAPDETLQLAAEMLYAHLLTPCVVGADVKRDLLNAVLSWRSSPVSIPSELDLALETCLINDMTFNLHRPYFLSFLINFARGWWAGTPQARTNLLQDPWAFKAFARGIPVDKAQGQRETLLYYVHPDAFEPISSQKHKERIATAFRQYAETAGDDVDRRLLAIRRALEPQFGEGFSFYREPVKVQWQQTTAKQTRERWDAFLEWIRKIIESKAFDKDERDYKLTVSKAVKDAQLVVDTDDWVVALRKAFTTPGNNLTNWMAHDRFVKWCVANPDDGRNALRALWTGDAAPAARLRSFLTAVPPEGLGGAGARVNIGSFLLIGEDPTRNPVVKKEAFKEAYRLSDHPSPRVGSDGASFYEHAVAFLDAIEDGVRRSGGKIRDRLDAQGAVWIMTKWEHPPSDWSEEDALLFQRFRAKEHDREEEPEPDGGEDDNDLEVLARELLIDRDSLDEMVQLITEKGQAIFYGPPGTGKTYIARKVAEHIAESPDRVAIVQFHPAYSYEDFVEGYRPSASGGFNLEPGPLRRIAERAAASNDQFVIIIDEINRANVAKVFGELYFLLEYRNESITPAYRPTEKLSLPKNLFLIGTMNTADRSIALLDSALRRRFYFLPFFPDQKPIEGLLRRWVMSTLCDGAGLEWVADVLDEANRRLRQLQAGRHLAVGPSHFMKKDLNSQMVERIWKHAVIPQLEEHFVGDEERVKEFWLDALKANVAGAGAGGDTGSGTPSD
jgi:hypothetical protein